MSRGEYRRLSPAHSGTIEIEDIEQPEPWDWDDDGWEGLPPLIRLLYLDVMHERLSGRRRYTRLH